MLATRLLPMLALLDDYQAGAFEGSSITPVYAPPGCIEACIAFGMGASRVRAYIPGTSLCIAEAMGPLSIKVNCECQR